MATPTLTKHSIPGALGPLLIDVRAGGRTSPRPAVVILHGFKGFKDWGMFPPLSERIARAGFTAISPNFSGSGVDDSGDFSLPELFGRNTFTAELQDSRPKSERPRDLGSDFKRPALVVWRARCLALRG